MHTSAMEFGSIRHCETGNIAAAFPTGLGQVAVAVDNGKKGPNKKAPWQQVLKGLLL